MQLELGEKPAEVACSWCGTPCMTVHQASPCCATCANAGPKVRVMAALRRWGRDSQR